MPSHNLNKLIAELEGIRFDGYSELEVSANFLWIISYLKELGTIERLVKSFISRDLQKSQRPSLGIFEIWHSTSQKEINISSS